MGTIAAIAAIVSSLMAAGVTVWQTVLAKFNSETREAIMSLVSRINEEIGKKRVSLSKLISALQSKSSRAVTEALYSNPIIAKSLKDMEKDQALINSISEQKAMLESEISELQNELNSLGYAQTHSAAKKYEQNKVKETEAKLNEKQARYDELINSTQNINLGSGIQATSVRTADIDSAVSQNLKGGIQ